MRILVCGAGGFIGSHLVRRMKSDGYFVRGVDLKRPEFSETAADEFIVGDLRDPQTAADAVRSCDWVFQLAAEMGGAGYIFVGHNDFEIMHNSVLINSNVIHQSLRQGVKRIFFSSSACIYPHANQMDPQNPDCREETAYPASPDSEYGWEKLFSERLFLAAARNRKIDVRIARYHNIFGPEGTWTGGREKSPAAICRKVAEARDGGLIEIWGDGKQTRSYLFIDECIEGTLRIMKSECREPLNLGSVEMISVDNLAAMAMKAAGKSLKLKHVPGPTGVRGRNSNNELIFKQINWAPSMRLSDGIEKTYNWILEQTRKKGIKAA